MLRRNAGIALPPSPVLEPPAVRGAYVQADLLGRLHESMRAAGYGARERSLWIEEAASGLLAFDPAVLSSVDGDYREDNAPAGFDARMKKLNVQIDPALDRQLTRVKERLVRDSPSLSGPFSFLIRAAIRHRLRNPGLYPRTSHADPDELRRRALAARVDGVLS